MTAPFSGKHILVVEDEYFIAADLRRALITAGATVVGPTGNLTEGLSLINDAPIDAALLDVNLEGDFSYPIADALAARGVPFLFLTGYDDWSLPEAYRSIQRIAKPFPIDTLMTAAGRLVEEGAPT